MLILAHTGITLGAAALAARALPGDDAAQGWFGRLGGWLDIRLLLVGSLLPDIIDKPLGQLLLSETFSNGRIFAHTLLFFILIAAAGYYLYHSRRQRWLLALAAGTLMHLVLDEMWLSPATLFWPLLGPDFPKRELASWLGNIFQAIISDPRTYVTELIGLAVLVWFLVWLLRRRVLAAFIRYGWVE
jgi:membrane-bound metal-dependent hydrolase YbcI (DUF457 family)